uniref:Adipocyte plasma membrane-associated protein n=1 Tax=Mesocestoides corti TaxID=53468 RepID=A0A5K3FCN2_MESCO
LDGSGASQFGPILPGHPTNVRASPRGGYWVPMTVSRHKSAPHMLDLLGRWPKLRANIFKLLSVEQVFQFAPRKHAIVVRIDENGRILESLHDTSGKITFMTEVS